LKNQPASLLPGGITFLQGMMSTGNDGMKPAYGNWKPDIASITADLEEVRKRIRDTFFNNLFNVASQFETRSNITAVEWDMRKAESLIMLGPVFQRLYNEVSPLSSTAFGASWFAPTSFPLPHQKWPGRTSMLSLAHCWRSPKTQPRPDPSNACSKSPANLPV